MVFSPLAKGAAAAASVTLALLLIAHAWYWHRGVSWIEGAVAGWSDDVRERGGRVEIGGLAVGGYPFGFEVRATSVLVEAGGAPPVRPWRGGAVRVGRLTADVEISGSGLGSLEAVLEDVVVSGHGLPGPLALESAVVAGARERRGDGAGAWRSAVSPSAATRSASRFARPPSSSRPGARPRSGRGAAAPCAWAA